jgi:outer membrane protein TolC
MPNEAGQICVIPEPPAAAASPGKPATPPPGDASLAGTTVLSVEALVQQVLARNPSLAQMVAAWEAASARYPQVTALDDPMFNTMFAPASIGSNAVEFGYRLEISQKLPFPGKRGLRGQNALAEASAARQDADDMRLQLVESARIAFYDYFLVYRAVGVNEESQRLLDSFRRNAQDRYERGPGSRQDVLQAEVEIGRQRERGLTLERMRKVAAARINTLLHLPPDAPLPPPPERLAGAETLPPAEVLRARALDQRPDLKALADRLSAEQASLALARKEFCPDFEVTAAYDTIMGNGPTRDLAPQVGLRLNLPVRRARRNGALAEAEARLAQRQAELARLTDQVYFQVQEAYEKVIESQQAMRLYEDTMLPAARKNVEAAQSAYTTGKIPFLSLIEAQRNLVMVRDRAYETLADYFRRRATLERMVGGPALK